MQKDARRKGAAWEGGRDQEKIRKTKGQREDEGRGGPNKDGRKEEGGGENDRKTWG